MIHLKHCFSVPACSQATQKRPSRALGLCTMNSSLLTSTLDFVMFYDLLEQSRESPVSACHVLKTPVLKLQQLLYLDCFSYIIPGDLSCFMLFNCIWEKE